MRSSSEVRAESTTSSASFVYVISFLLLTWYSLVQADIALLHLLIFPATERLGFSFHLFATSSLTSSLSRSRRSYLKRRADFFFFESKVERIGLWSDDSN